MNCGSCCGGCIRILCCCGRASCRDQDCFGIETAMEWDGLSVCHAAIVELNSPLDRITMTDAWYKTIQTHPFLRAKWSRGFIAKVKENTEPTYLEIPGSQDMVDQLIIHSNKDAKFAELTVCEQGLTIQILVTIPHSLADGTAMMIILNDLLKFYEKPHQSAILNEDYPVQAEKLKPKLSKEAIKNYKRKILTQQKEFKNVVPHQKFKERDPEYMPTHVTIRKGTPDGLQKLLHFCRNNGITVGTYLMAAFNCALAQDKMVKLGNELKMDIDFNLRDRFPQKLGNTVVACYIGVGSIVPKAELTETLVDVAKRIKNEINEQLENQEPFMMRAMMDILGSSDGKEFNKPINNHIASSVNFSNIGKYKFETQFNFGKIRELYCSGNKWTKAYEYCLTVQTTDKLCLTITHPTMPIYEPTANIYGEYLMLFANDPERFGNMTLKDYENFLN
ncbi:Oidioi.mRNA.OKI2018_I69.chr2.g5941.t1.cds [Oikopleura dioica]|uniref:Oidioi.mRNA.OKI2018_I69.chr2.g5941.t1.cds n=1 Tax=Oikopleura dioica TaxID=34765 RepID=A0ABN7T1W2_OIKDI|nr:Oidioi.mRNA.OKI2018_I69.chr2.g5941.t1.cds [Oikopleura dioica]